MKSSSAFHILAAAATLIAAASAETIQQVQGPSHFGMDGKVVTDVRGVLTQKNGKNGFWIQDPVGDGDDKTSDGVLVYIPAANKEMNPISEKLAVGDYVSVSGSVKEYAASGFPTNLFLTEIDLVTNITVLPKGPTVAPTIIGKDGRKPPTQTVFTKFDDGPEAAALTPTDQAFFKTYPALDVANKGLDFLESLEGMLVTIKNPIVTGQPFSDQFWVLPDAGEGVTGRNAAGGITMSQTPENGNDNNPERIFIGGAVGGSHPKDLALGDQVEDITGVVTYDRGFYKVIPTAKAVVVKKNTNAQPAAPPTPADEYAVGSYNMENLGGAEPQAKFDKIAAQIVKYLGSPAILVANEIQDNDGPTVGDSSDSTVTINRLIAAIAAAGGPTYKATWINPTPEQDGGQPGGNIRSVVLYDQAAGVTLSPGTPGTAEQSVNITKDDTGKPALSLNPGRIDPTNAAWEASRKTLAVSLQVDGERVFVLANHFTSKGGGSSIHGSVHPMVAGGVDRRVAQAKLNHDFSRDILAADPAAKIIVVGDLNDFAWSAPLRTLYGTAPGQAGEILYDLGEESLPVAERYSYNFDGQSQELDHVVTSKALLDSMTSFVCVHVNTWGAIADRTSDHDPQYARFKRNGKVPVTSTTSSPATEPTTTTTSETPVETATETTPVETSATETTPVETSATETTPVETSVPSVPPATETPCTTDIAEPIPSTTEPSVPSATETPCTTDVAEPNPSATELAPDATETPCPTDTETDYETLTDTLPTPTARPPTYPTTPATDPTFSAAAKTPLLPALAAVASLAVSFFLV
ncbi:Endonuclease/exonuclease/phosphatase [Powellomyces hirtus]|nr:Endonuclease/exonuclease/phosphatase [Powellomyces hirtus]